MIYNEIVNPIRSSYPPNYSHAAVIFTNAPDKIYYIALSTSGQHTISSNIVSLKFTFIDGKE